MFGEGMLHSGGHVAFGLVVTALCVLARRDEDMVSWWITGTREQLYFYVLYKSSIHGAVRLQKMAGDMLERTYFDVCIVILIVRTCVCGFG